MSISRLVVLIVVSASFVSELSAQELLTWKFSKGEKLTYGVVQNMQTSQTIADKEIKSSVSQQMDMGWQVMDVSAGGAAVMHQTIHRVRMKMEGGPAGTLDFDTAQKVPPGNPLAARLSSVFGGMLNQPFVVTTLPSGKVEEVKVPPLLLETIRKTASANSGALTEEMLQDMMKQSAVTLPDEPVGPNSKWASSQQVKLPFGMMNVKSIMTYVSKDSAGNIIIDVTPEISVTPTENVANKMSLTTSEGRGRVIFDNRLGRVTQSQLNLTLMMKMEVEGKSFDQVVKQTTAMKLSL